MAREARCSIAVRVVSISTDAPAAGRRPIHNDDSMRSARRPETKGRSRRSTTCRRPRFRRRTSSALEVATPTKPNQLVENRQVPVLKMERVLRPYRYLTVAREDRADPHLLRERVKCGTTRGALRTGNFTSLR